MAEPRTATLSFGFQEPKPGDFGRLATALLRMAETEIGQTRSRARLMVIPSLAFYLLFAFGFGVLLWSVGIELRPIPMMVATTIAFLIMAGLGRHYEDESDWSSAAEGVSRMHRRFLVQGMFVNLLTGAFFTLPALVFKNLAALFPRRPRVDTEVLAVATNLAAALDEAAPVIGPDAIMPRSLTRAVVEESVLLLVWAGVASANRSAGHVVLQPGPRRGRLLSEMSDRIPYIIYLSALPRDSRRR